MTELALKKLLASLCIYSSTMTYNEKVECINVLTNCAVRKGGEIISLDKFVKECYPKIHEK